MARIEDLMAASVDQDPVAIQAQLDDVRRLVLEKLQPPRGGLLDQMARLQTMARIRCDIDEILAKFSDEENV